MTKICIFQKRHFKAILARDVIFFVIYFFLSWGEVTIVTPVTASASGMKPWLKTTVIGLPARWPQSCHVVY